MLKADKKGQLFCATNLYFYYSYLHLNEVSKHKVLCILFKTCYLSFLFIQKFYIVLQRRLSLTFCLKLEIKFPFKIAYSFVPSNYEMRWALRTCQFCIKCTLFEWCEPIASVKADPLLSTYDVT